MIFKMDTTEIKQGKDIVDKASVKDNWKESINYYIRAQFSSVAFCLENGLDPKEYFDLQDKIFNRLGAYPMTNPVAQSIIRKMPSHFVLSQFVKFILNIFQAFHKLKSFTVQLKKKSAILEINKCIFRKRFKQYINKTKIDMQDEVPCYFCHKMFENATPFGITTEIKPTKVGCIITFNKR